MGVRPKTVFAQSTYLGNCAGFQPKEKQLDASIKIHERSK